MGVSLVPATGRWSFKATSAGLAQFTFVALDANAGLVAPSAGQLSFVLDDAGPAGVTVANVNYGVVFEGVIKVIAGATLTPGALVSTNSSGQAIPVLSTNTILGVAFAAGVSGDLVPIRVTLSGAIHA